MKTEREQDRPSEPAASKAETGKRTPATPEKIAEQLGEIAEQLDELETVEKLVDLDELNKGIEAFKLALQSALLTEVREPEAAAVVEALKSRAAVDITPWQMLAGQAGPDESRLLPPVPEEHEVAADVDAILKRLDQGIAAEHAAMDRLLERIVSRTPR
jgi:hypothetical protein